MERACEPNCPCEPLTGWRTQEISLPALEEVEISGFEFGNHDFEFLRLISRSAPMLKTLSVSLLPRGIPSRNDLRAKVRNILGAHSSVEFTLDLSSGEYMFYMHNWHAPMFNEPTRVSFFIQLLPKSKAQLLVLNLCIYPSY